MFIILNNVLDLNEKYWAGKKVIKINLYFQIFRVESILLNLIYSILSIYI